MEKTNGKLSVWLVASKSCLENFFCSLSVFPSYGRSGLIFWEN